jgi:Questin oxidase-like
VKTDERIGFLHPLIHLGFGIEFRQPAIIAEALAQAAVHDNWIGKLLLPAEKAAQEDPPKEIKTLVELLDEIHADKKLSNAAHWDDGNKIRDGILARAGDRMLGVAKQYTVNPEDLEWRTPEMINAAGESCPI